MIIESQPVEDILIARNDFFGNERDLLSNQSGSALPSGAVTFDSNRINPVGLPGPSFDPTGGFHWDSVTVGLTAADANETIYYSTDGSDPRVAGHLYDEPIVLLETTEIRAASQNDAGDWSDVTSASYEVIDSETRPPSPTSPQVERESGGVRLSWGNPGGRVSGYEIRRSGDGVHYETIGQVDASTLSFLDENAGNAGTLNYRIVSLRQGLESEATATLHLQPSSVDPFDGTGWTGVDLGSPDLTGSHSTSTGSAEVTAGGTDIWGSADEGYFLHRSAEGDWSLTARLDSFDAVNIWTKVGLMIRSGTAPNATNTFLGATGSNGIVRQERQSDGAATSTLSGSDSGAPVWQRMEKQGSTLTLSESADGSSWSVVDSVSWNSGSGDVVGFAAVSHERDQLSTAVFSNIVVD